MRRKDLRIGSGNLFRLFVVIIIFSLSIYIVWQKNRSLQVRYNIAQIEDQNGKIKRVVDIATVQFYKNSSILKLQNYAFNDGLTYYDSKVVYKLKPAKQVLIALLSENASGKQ